MVEEDDDDAFGMVKELDDSDIEDIGKMSAPLSKEQKLSQRMQRKAESARIARLRKKEYVSGLEDHIKELTAALAAAREANRSSKVDAAPAGLPLPAPIKCDNPSHKHDNGSGTKLEVNGTVETFVSNKRKSAETLNEYLDCIEDILSPTAPLQVAWSQPEGENEKAADSGSASEGDAKRQRRESVSEKLTRELTIELGLSAQQVQQLAQLQASHVKPDKEIVAECLRLLEQLRSKIKEHTGASQRTTDLMRRILEQSQVPKYLDWVERHQKSMQTYNKIVE